MKKCPSSIQCPDSNPRPLDCESLPITTRPGLPPNSSLKCYPPHVDLVKFANLYVSQTQHERCRHHWRVQHLKLSLLFFKWANSGLFLLMFVLFKHNFYWKKLQASAWFELGTSEYKARTLTTWTPQPRPEFSYLFMSESPPSQLHFVHSEIFYERQWEANIT